MHELWKSITGNTTTVIHTKLNGALAGTGMRIGHQLRHFGNWTMNNAAVRNNGGGLLQSLFVLASDEPKLEEEPSGDLAQAIDAAYGSFDDFKDCILVKQLLRDLVLDGLGFVFTRRKSRSLFYCQPRQSFDARYWMWRNSYPWV